MNQPNLLFMPRVFNIPKVEHDQPCSTLVVLFFQISLFIYFNLGPGPIRAKNNVNKQTNLENKTTKVEHGWSCSTLGMLKTWGISLCKSPNLSKYPFMSRLWWKDHMKNSFNSLTKMVRASAIADSKLPLNVHKNVN